MLEKILFTIPVKGSKAQLYSSGASTMVFSSRGERLDSTLPSTRTSGESHPRKEGEGQWMENY